MAKTDPGRSVSLPVLKPGAAPKMGSTRIARWRTAALVLVHVLMVAHLIQWLIMGMTVSPVEPSEAMQTLEGGFVNAGAIVLLIGVVSTLIFGRYFCGWACHVVALQDACAWIMNKMGVRPKPFRSRLLIWAPVAIGFYMFLWPNFKRLLVAPVLENMGIAWPNWLRPVAPINMWQSEMIVDDFWATFPEWYIAIPFLFICGFVTVYFLGAKGFCTYACPYGGVFSPVERIAPVRIRVTDACQHCGHCTSVCTSNVQVAQEVHDFGMVVDPGCMKCMDCVSACPSDALYVGLGKPAVGAKPRDKESAKKSRAKKERRYDLTRRQELVAALIFLGIFLSTRGMLEQVPMLLAGGLAAIGTMGAMMAWSILTQPHARLYGLVFKQHKKVRPLGYAFVLLTVGLGLVTAWGGHARYNRWRADIEYAGAQVPAGLALRPEYAPSVETRLHAEKAARWLELADSPKNGGRGWNLNAEHRTRQAYFLTLLGRYDEAGDALDVVLEEGKPGTALIDQLVQLRIRAGMSQEEASAVYERALEAHPELHSVRLAVSLNAASLGGPSAGAPYWEIDDPELAQDLSEDLGHRMAEMSFYVRTGQRERALELLDEFVPLAEQQGHRTSGWIADAASVAMTLGESGRTADLIQRALDAEGVHPGVWFAGAEVAATFGNGELAIERINTGLSIRGGDTFMSLNRAGGLLLRLQQPDRALELLTRAVGESEQPFERASVGRTLVRAGRGMQRADLVAAGVEAMREAAESSGQPLLYHELALGLLEAGQDADAAPTMATAAGLAPDSIELARRTADLYNRANNAAEATRWDEEAQRREAASAP